MYLFIVCYMAFKSLKFIATDVKPVSCAARGILTSSLPATNVNLTHADDQIWFNQVFDPFIMILT